ncbi:MAG: tetratricopeptide repeat protein [Clostridia bacterium]|nr:tetratricopeptide repeat protein [Clostridia bacterium]
MKRISVIVLCCMALLLTSCNLITNKNYKEGIQKLEDNDYVAAELCFEKAIDEGYDKDDIEEIYDIVSEYNMAKEAYDKGEFDDAKAHMEDIHRSYSDYPIEDDVDALKDKLEIYDEGIIKLEIKDYAISEACFKKLLELDPDNDDINVIYTIISDYNTAKSHFDKGEYYTAIAYLDKIPHSYVDYPISADIDVLNTQLKSFKETSASITKATSLLESGEYNEAGDVLLTIDDQYVTDEQREEIKALQKQIQLKKKNQDPVALNRLNALADAYSIGLCEAVNSGVFAPLNGTLYHGSSIYAEQVAYIAKMSKISIYERCLGMDVISVNWTSESTCVISTIETYEISNYSAGRFYTETFRYTYDVIETSDGQLFLTTIRKSN